MAKNDYFNLRLSMSELPTNWLWFYVKIRFPLGIIISIISMITSFSQINFSLYSGLGIVIILFFFSFDIINVVLTIWAYVEMKNLSTKGFKLNKVLLWYGVFYLALSKSIEYINTDSTAFWSGLFAGAIAGLIWLWPNMVYFNKRKYLFGSEVSDYAPLRSSSYGRLANLTSGAASVIIIISYIISSIVYIYSFGLWYERLSFLGIILALFGVPDLVLAVLEFIDYRFGSTFVILVLANAGTYILFFILSMISSAFENKSEKEPYTLNSSSDDLGQLTLEEFNDGSNISNFSDQESDATEYEINSTKNIIDTLTEKPEDLIVKIEKLSILKEKGIITEGEFQQKKQELLERM